MVSFVPQGKTHVFGGLEHRDVLLAHPGRDGPAGFGLAVDGVRRRETVLGEILRGVTQLDRDRGVSIAAQRLGRHAKLAHNEIAMPRAARALSRASSGRRGLRPGTR